MEDRHGVLSVLSNILPNEMLDNTKSCQNQDWIKAREIHNNLTKLLDALFIETNPQPIKILMAKECLCQEKWRSPRNK